MEKKNKLRTIKIVSILVFNLICLFSIIYVIAISGEKKQAMSEEPEVKVIREFEGPKKEATLAETKETAEIKPVEVAQPEVKQAVVQAVVQVQPTGKVFLVDDFAGDEIKNRVGSRANVYVRAPSRVMIARRDDIINGNKKKVLMIKYDKKNTGGPGGMGGWCGYYTIIKNEKTGQYLNGTSYKCITLWVRGEKGDENFMVGLADEHWDKIGDSLKAEEIGVYLEKGKITTQWQKARVLLDVFFLDHANLSAISINFEADCFPEGAGMGVVYISDIALEK